MKRRLQEVLLARQLKGTSDSNSAESRHHPSPGSVPTNIIPNGAHLPPGAVTQSGTAASQHHTGAVGAAPALMQAAGQGQSGPGGHGAGQIGWQTGLAEFPLRKTGTKRRSLEEKKIPIKYHKTSHLFCFK